MNSAIILLAGSGSRMKMNKNKILLDINGKPVYSYSINTFYKLGFEIVCVVKDSEYDYFKANLPSYCKLCIGGATRGESVLNGLKEARGDYVFIHDGARPFISSDVISYIVNNVNKNEGALCYLNVKDTIKENNDGKLSTLKREKLIAAVTPQCGPREILMDSYIRGINDKITFTDDMSLLEIYHPEVKINLVLANEEVFKLTTALDYEIAKLIGGRFDD